MHVSTSLAFTYAPRPPWADFQRLAGELRPSRAASSPTAEQADGRVSSWLRVRSFLAPPNLQASALRGGLALLREERAALRTDLMAWVTQTLSQFQLRNVVAELVRAASVAAFMHFGVGHDAAPQVRPAAPAMAEPAQVSAAVCGPLKEQASGGATKRATGRDPSCGNENEAARSHLQAQFLRARGRPLVADLLHHLDGYIRHPAS